MHGPIIIIRAVLSHNTQLVFYVRWRLWTLVCIFFVYTYYAAAASLSRCMADPILIDGTPWRAVNPPFRFGMIFIWQDI